jgi:hypothetical protein
MKSHFEKYLIEKGYKTYTPSGKPSTVYDYVKRIDTVCKWENKNWIELAENISFILNEYEAGGEKQDLGAKSHNAIRCALRCFNDFIESNL